jgi:CTP synthase (UTP-ammonia lyase)
MYHIGIIGDYDESRPSHIATNKALCDCVDYLGMEVDIRWIPTESLNGNTADKLQGYQGLFCSPGSPYKSMNGALNAIKYARVNKIPFLGTCGGFQHAVLEYAISVLGYKNAAHFESNPESNDIFITPLSCSLLGETRVITISKDTYIYGIYQSDKSVERYNCTFGLNPMYQQKINDSGLKVAAVDESGEARILVLPDNKFYVATLFQPQLSSSTDQPHKLIEAFLRSIL